MGIFKKNRNDTTPRSSRRSTLICPRCHGGDLALGYVDRVNLSVLHRCHSCGYRWRDDLVDLADHELHRRGAA